MSIVDSGVTSLTIGNEHTLSQINSFGTFQLHADIDTLTTSEYIRFRVYSAITSGASLKKIDEFVGALVPTIRSDWFTEGVSLKFTAQQDIGAIRTVTWRVVRPT